ncbi:MAG: hypothetical protein ACK5ZE_07935 [Pseudanabaena sp.]|jgi:hypothetical protein
MEYQVSDIRELVEKALTNEQLNNLLFDDFPFVFNNTQGQLQGVKIRQLIEHAEKHDEFAKITKFVEKHNPNFYKKFEARFLDISDISKVTIPITKSSTSMNQNILRRKIEILKKEADVVLGQWESAVSDEQREQLWRRLEQKQAQIAEAERGLG